MKVNTQAQISWITVATSTVSTPKSGFQAAWDETPFNINLNAPTPAMIAPERRPTQVSSEVFGCDKSMEADCHGHPPTDSPEIFLGRLKIKLNSSPQARL